MTLWKSPRPTSRTSWSGSSDTNRKSPTSSNPPAATTGLPDWPWPHSPEGFTERKVVSYVDESLLLLTVLASAPTGHPARSSAGSALARSRGNEATVAKVTASTEPNAMTTRETHGT